MNYRYFKLSEFACKETGENHIEPQFVAVLDEARHRAGFPFHVNSGYRSPNHSKERDKEKAGMHTTGKAADIAVADGVQKYKIVQIFIVLGFTGIGVGKDFVHGDLREGQRVMWDYS